MGSNTVHRISVVIPAWNEQAELGRTLTALTTALSTVSRPSEVIVVDDGSTDQTARIATEAGAQVIRLHRRQIAAARNAGARMARGDLLVFLDADTRVSREVLPATVRAVEAGAVGGGCVVRFERPAPRYVSLLEPLAGLFCRAVGLAHGCYLFATAEAYAASGGFDETLYAAEEVYFSRAVRRLGRFVILPQPVFTSSRKLRSFPASHIFGLLFRIAWGRRRFVTQRGKLGLWYGPEARSEAQQKIEGAAQPLSRATRDLREK